MNRLTRYSTNGANLLGDITVRGDVSVFRDALNKLAAYEDIGLAPDEVARLTAEFEQYHEDEADGRLVRLPCEVGSTVYVIMSCKDIQMYQDNDWEHGTGAIECLFENQCKCSDCEDNPPQVLETIVTHWWLQADEEESKPEAFLESSNRSYYAKDFGKTVFLTREEAEAVLKAQEVSHE